MKVLWECRCGRTELRDPEPSSNSVYRHPSAVRVSCTYCQDSTSLDSVLNRSR